MPLHAQVPSAAEDVAAAEPATDAHDATRYIEAAAPSAAAATFVRPPPAFRLATTSLWVPTHGGSDHRASSGSERGEGSGRGPHAGNGSDSIEVRCLSEAKKNYELAFLVPADATPLASSRMFTKPVGRHTWTCQMHRF